MKCKLYNPNDDLEAVWISWVKIQEYWKRNTFHPLSHDELKPALHNLWFANKNDGTVSFKIGAIFFNHIFNCIMFHNGRHRTILLTKYRDDIPIAICSSISDHKIIGDSIIRKIRKDDFIELPELPIKSYTEFRK